MFFLPFRNDMKNYKNKNKFHKLNVAKTYFHRLSGGNNIKTNKTNVNRYSLSAKKTKIKQTECENDRNKKPKSFRIHSVCCCYGFCFILFMNTKFFMT